MMRNMDTTIPSIFVDVSNTCIIIIIVIMVITNININISINI